MNGTRPEAVLDHCYDGIQEYDNPTPGWWWLVFVATIVFSVAYFTFFQVSPDAWTNTDEHSAAVARNLRLQFGEIGDLTADEATLLKYMNDPKWLTVGKTVFAGQCVVCHGPDASGAVGPNLTDDYWKNVRKLEDVAGVIANGAANGAMPKWKDRLHPNEVVLTAAYIASLRGQNLPSTRPREGDAIPPWPTAAATSSPTAASPSSAPQSEGKR